MTAQPQPHAQSKAKFVISIPHSAAPTTRKPAIITSQTATIVLSVVSVNGAPPTYTIPSLTVHLNDPAYCTTSGGTTTCTISYSVPVSTNVVVAITTYDSSGNELGSGTLSVDTTQTTIPPTTVAIGGVPTTAQFTQSSLVLADNGTSTSISGNLTLKVYDADNNLLISPATYGGAITIAATNNTNAALTFPQTSITAPDDTTGASNTIPVLYDGTKALAATTTITASYNGHVLASVPVTAMNYTPSSLTNLVIGGPTETVTVNEGGYSGAFSLSGNGTNLSYTCSPSICSPSTPGGNVTFTITPQATGTGTLVFSDVSGNKAYVGFTVTGQTGGTINLANYKSYTYSPPTSNSHPSAIAAGPDGKSVWFTESTAGQVARVNISSCVDTTTPATCTITEQADSQNFPQPSGIVSGNDGNIYVANGVTGGTFAQLATAGSTCVTTQPMTCTSTGETLGSQTALPTEFVRGNNGNIYLLDTGSGANNIWYFNPSDQNVNPYEVFTSPSSSWSFSAITVDTTNNFWVTDNSDAMVANTYRSCGDCPLSLEEFGGFTASTNATPTFSGMTTGNDGNLWVIEDAANDIAYFDPASCSGSTCTVNRVSIPTANAGAAFIAQGTDGNMWFTESNTGKIGIVTNCPSACKVVELSVASAGSGLAGIAAGPDGNMWFTLLSSGQVGKVVP